MHATTATNPLKTEVSLLLPYTLPQALSAPKLEEKHEAS